MSDVIFTPPDSDLEITPAQPNVGIDEAPVIEVELVDETTGQPVPGADVFLKVRREMPGPTGIHDDRTYMVMDELDVGHHTATVTTDADGRAMWTVPSDLEDAGTRFNTPSGIEHDRVVGEIPHEDVTVFDVTRYTVGPAP